MNQSSTPWTSISHTGMLFLENSSATMSYERAPVVKDNTNAKAPATNTGASSSGSATIIGHSPGASSTPDTVSVVPPQKQFKPNASDTNPRTGTASAAYDINLITPSITPTKFEDGCLDVLATAVSSAVGNNNDNEVTACIPSLSVPGGAVSHHARSGTINPSMTPAGHGHPEPSFWAVSSTASVTPTGVSYPQGFERIKMLLLSASIADRVLAVHHDVPPSPPSPHHDVPPSPPSPHHDVPPSPSPSPPSPQRRSKFLYVPGEEGELNQLHCFLRRECIELIEEESDVEDFLPVKKRRKVSCKVGGQLSFVAGKGGDDNENGKFPKRVGLCCAFCKQTSGPAAIWPNSFRESQFYCKVVNFKSAHFDICPSVPDAIRQKCERAYEDKSRGRKMYWVQSARKIGLVEIKDEDGRPAGIAFA